MPSFFDKLLRRQKDGTATRASDSPGSRDVSALLDRGNVLEDAGDLEGAHKLYSQAIAQVPNSVRAHLNLGNALFAARRFGDAQASYRRALELDPAHYGANLNLGNTLLADENAREALVAYREAVRLRPDAPDAWTGLGCALEESGALGDAVDAYRGALRCDPTFAGAVGNLVDVLISLRRGGEARELLEDILRRYPDHVPARRRLAYLDRDWGESEAAVAGLRAVLASTPDDLASRSDLLFATQLLPQSDNATVVAEHRRFGEWLCARVQRLPLHNTPLPERRLKIGLVSPDLRRHPVAVFVEPLLRYLDRGAFELRCYYTHKRRDEITELLAQVSDAWLDAAQLDDDSLARRLCADGIDILFDLAGHTAGQRLGVFARKPAPLQFSWLGYLATTGLDTIDYRLCDRLTDPVGQSEAWQVETPVRMPDSQWCYSPLFEIPPPGPLPRLKNGCWTFGSTNQIAKLNRRCLAVWADLLHAVRDSRLRILGVNDPWVEQRLLHEFAQHGIATDRIELAGRLPLPEYFAAYRAIDILFDSFPYNGGTTTCDALIMGVPVATMAGDRSIARGGVSLLSTVGLEDWIAPNEDVLRELLLNKTTDVDGMAALRADLPGRMRGSPIMDAPRYARNFEALLREAWRRWCAENRSDPASAKYQLP